MRKILTIILSTFFYWNKNSKRTKKYSILESVYEVTFLFWLNFITLLILIEYVFNIEFITTHFNSILIVLAILIFTLLIVTVFYKKNYIVIYERALKSGMSLQKRKMITKIYLILTIIALGSSLFLLSPS